MNLLIIVGIIISVYLLKNYFFKETFENLKDFEDILECQNNDKCFGELHKLVNNVFDECPDCSFDEFMTNMKNKKIIPESVINDGFRESNYKVFKREHNKNKKISKRKLKLFT